jgi:hypothetical protein
MNKIYSISLSIACFLLFSSNIIKAQDTIKPSLKGWSTELNFNPFNGSLTLNNAYGQIKIRKFLPNDIALRLAFTLSYKNNEDKMENPYGPYPLNSTDKRQSFMVAINFGTEKHFSSTRRISPYIGWEIGLGIQSSKEDIKNNDYSKTIKGGWQTYELNYSGQNYYLTTNYSERGFWSAGANALTGFDFYMAKDFYFGYEIGFGFEYIKYSKIVVTKDTEFPDTGSYPDQDGSSWKVGPRLVNGIRIGYTF